MRIGILNSAFLFSLGTTPAFGDWASSSESLIANTRDQPVLVMPSSETRFDGVTSYGAIALEVEDGQSHRIFRVTLDGEDYETKLPATTSNFHLAFDPKRRTFTRLLPSLRIELTEGANLTLLLESLQAAGITKFEPLGFAFVDLPEDLHPMDALAIIENLDGDYSATLRLPMPPITWR